MILGMYATEISMHAASTIEIIILSKWAYMPTITSCDQGKTYR